jgi:hypothetical protein
MSLINDALKKAGATPAPTTPAPTKEPLHFATHQPPPRWPMFVVPPLVAVVFAAGTILVMRGWQSGRPVSAREGTRSETPQVSAAPTPEVSKSPETLTAATAQAATNSTPPVAATFPTLKVQGVIWHPRRPSVVINGKSLFIGEKIERALVKAIEEDGVTVVWNGEQRLLTIP